TGTVASASGWRWSYRGVGALIAAVLLIAMGCVEAKDTYFLHHRGVTAVGTVVEKVSNRRTSTRVKVAYTTRAGTPVTAKASYYGTVKVGQQIELVYDRENPHRVRSVTESTGYWTFYLCLGFALIVLVLGLVEFRTGLLGRWRRGTLGSMLSRR
ncbi:MAG TPA: DUF3592 domain-containing protein, partial [Kribbella sp.]|nr:DUF3592 domain-containing protein [Kribbella sp.]